MSLIFLSLIIFLHYFVFFFFNDTATTEIYTLSLHDALPIFFQLGDDEVLVEEVRAPEETPEGVELDTLRSLFGRSEEHTSELQSPCNLVCRLLLEKKKKYNNTKHTSAPTVSTLSRNLTVQRY